MTATDAQLEDLSDDQRQALETWLVEFDLAWDEGRLALWLSRLPPRGDCLRRPALVEMVKIDLERRWQRGQRANLEAYAQALPELGAPDRLPADLLLAEYEARQQCGAPADLAEFARRFPRQVDELRLLVGQLREEGACAVRRASPEAGRPAEQAADAGGPRSSPCRPVSRPPDPVTPDFPAPPPAPPPTAGRGAAPRAAWLARKPLWLALAGAAAAVLVGIALRVAHSTGTVRIELDGPPAEVEVYMDGERLGSAAVNEPLRLRPGDHHLLVTGQHIQPGSAFFTGARGANPTLRVPLAPRAGAAADPAPLPSRKAPRRPEDDRYDDG